MPKLTAWNGIFDAAFLSRWNFSFSKVEKTVKIFFQNKGGEKLTVLPNLKKKA